MTLRMMPQMRRRSCQAEAVHCATAQWYRKHSLLQARIATPRRWCRVRRAPVFGAHSMSSVQWKVQVGSPEGTLVMGTPNRLLRYR